MKMVFVGGQKAPNLVLSRVYDLQPRHISFSWFVEAPDGAKIGEILVGWRTVESQKITEAPELSECDADLSVPKDYVQTALMRFRKCKGSPKGFKHDEVVELPLRYARFPWFVLVDE